MARMQQIDAQAIEVIGIPRLLLMEHAGLAIARATQALTTSSRRSILVCCGLGLNGGDGFAAARHLLEGGYSLRIIVAGPLTRLREEPATYATILRRLGLSLVEYVDATTSAFVNPWMDECDLIVDALLGIGARGPVREPLASLITLMNHSGKPIVAADIPSGLNAETGCVQGVAVQATTTVTFGLPKQGCLVSDGPRHTGLLQVDAISIPRTLLRGSSR